MSDPRLPRREGHAGPGACFRCVPCRRVVTGTERGVCPRCGWTPPSLVRVPPARRRGAASLGGGYWLAAAALSLVLAVVAAALAVRLW